MVLLSVVVLGLSYVDHVRARAPRAPGERGSRTSARARPSCSRWSRSLATGGRSPAPAAVVPRLREHPRRPARRPADHRSQRGARRARRNRERRRDRAPCSRCPPASPPATSDTDPAARGQRRERAARQHGVPRHSRPAGRPPTARGHRDRPGRDEGALPRHAAARCSPASSCSCFAAGIAVWLARRLTRPIREIERAAGQLASGDLSGRADVPPGTDADLADARRHAQRDGGATRGIARAANARSCSRSPTTSARRSRRSAATRKRSPTARSTTPTPTPASARRR